MKKSIETPRMLMREITIDDAPGLFELDSNPEVHRFLGNNPVTSMDRVYEVINFIQTQYEQNGIGRWAVILKETGQFMGWSGLKLHGNMNGRETFHDLGYRFIPEFWGKGYATETAKAFVEYGFKEMNLELICSHTMQGNAASAKVLQNAGLQLTGAFEHENDPCYWFEITRSMFFAQP